MSQDVGVRLSSTTNVESGLQQETHESQRIYIRHIPCAFCYGRGHWEQKPCLSCKGRSMLCSLSEYVVDKKSQ